MKTILLVRKVRITKHGTRICATSNQSTAENVDRLRRKLEGIK